ncbi:hypothetical protein ILYODFUR_017956 [Ilyodon furcidens]|uniref:Uncharacterized protein n=1 Tax=Ilyodon furcidens TaxID=33524 RepID=A0ABV0TJS1_9TELE
MRASGLMVEAGFKVMKYSEVARESCKKHTLQIASFEASKTSGVMMNNESVTANFLSPPRQSVPLQTFLDNIRNHKPQLIFLHRLITGRGLRQKHLGFAKRPIDSDTRVLAYIIYDHMSDIFSI